MGPYERPRGPRGTTKKQFPFRYVRTVPELLWQKSPIARARFKSGQQPTGFVEMPRCDFVVGALSREQRPRTADTVAVECPSVIVLAVPVTVVAPPDGPERHVCLEQSIDYRDGVEDPWIVG